MTLPTINISTLHIFDGSKDLGHVIDAIVSKTVDHAEAKAALDLAWIAKNDQVNDHKRESDLLKLTLRDKADEVGK